MTIEAVDESTLEEWVGQRAALWPDEDTDELREEARNDLADPSKAAFLAREADTTCGFVEVALYRGDGSPYCHIEGWGVAPEFRGRGIGRSLLERAEEWALHHHISVMTSDTTARYPLRPAAHAAAGYTEIDAIRVFVRKIGPT